MASRQKIAQPKLNAVLARRDSVDRAERSLNIACFLSICAGAFILRVVYLLQIDSIPLFNFLAGDGRTYDEWAQRIAAGDWLGQGVFYQAPLYPYFLGVLQFVFGHNLWLIRFLQLILGAISCGLVYLVGQKLFSRKAGIAAGVLLACYAPAIFFDGLIEKSILDLFLLSLLLFLLICVGDGIWAKWLGAGAVLALLGLSRENALILTPVVAVWIWLYFSGQAVSIRTRWLGLFIGGLFLVLVPVGLRNLAVGGEFKLTTAQFGANFFIGNNPSADGTYASVRKQIGAPQLEGSDAMRLAEKAMGRMLTPGEVSSYWFNQAWEYIRSQPLEWLGLFARKWLIVWNQREIEDSDDFYLYQKWSWLLRFLGWFSHFGVLAPLAALGAFVTLREWRRVWLLHAMILSLSLSVAIFYVFGRYRFPLVPLLALLAGAGIAQLPAFLRERDWRSMTLVMAVFLPSAAIVNWKMFDVNGPGPGGYNNLANAYQKQGNLDAAIETVLQALRVDPGYGVGLYNLGNFYASQGKFDLAQIHYRKAIEIYPNHAEARSNLGFLLAQNGNVDAGIEQFRKAIEIHPFMGRAYLNLGAALVQLDRFDEAIDPLEKAVEYEPESDKSQFYLGSVYAARGRYEDAVKRFNAALRIRGDFPEAHERLARVLSLQGRKEEAMRHYQEAVRLMKQPRSESARP